MCEHAPALQSVLVCDAAPTERHVLTLLVATAAEFGGVVSRFRTDGVAATFASPNFAVCAAIEMQRATRNVGCRGLAIGVDHGEVERVRGLGPIGIPPYVAGELARCCRPGEIALTDTVVDHLDAPLPAASVATLTAVLHGLDGRRHVHVVMPRSVAGTRSAPAQEIVSPMANSTP